MISVLQLKNLLLIVCDLKPTPIILNRQILNKRARLKHKRDAIKHLGTKSDLKLKLLH